MGPTRPESAGGPAAESPFAPVGAWRARRAGFAFFPRKPSRAGRADWPGRAPFSSWSSRAYRTLRAGNSLRPLRSDLTLRSLCSLRARRPLRPFLWGVPTGGQR